MVIHVSVLRKNNTGNRLKSKLCHNTVVNKHALDKMESIIMGKTMFEVFKELH